MGRFEADCDAGAEAESAAFGGKEVGRLFGCWIESGIGIGSAIGSDSEIGSESGFGPGDGVGFGTFLLVISAVTVAVGAGLP